MVWYGILGFNVRPTRHSIGHFGDAEGKGRGRGRQGEGKERGG